MTHCWTSPNRSQPVPQTASPSDDGDAGRYGAIIDFPNFLLHVLRLYAGGDGDISLDDKKLVAQFERTITSGSAALDFAYRLLRAKFLFDNFIIKPVDEPGGSDDSNWVIHRLHYTRPEARSAKLSPRNAFGMQTQQVLMLQAMYQVTQPAPRLQGVLLPAHRVPRREMGLRPSHRRPGVHRAHPSDG